MMAVSGTKRQTGFAPRSELIAARTPELTMIAVVSLAAMAAVASLLV